jgi:hypothetical protein
MQFDEAEYRRRLIAMGTDPAVASDIAAKTAANRNRQGQEAREEQRKDAQAKTNADPTRGPARAGHVLRKLQDPASEPTAASPALAPSPSSAKPKRARATTRGKPTPKTATPASNTAAPAKKSRRAKGPAPLPEKAFSNPQLSLFQSFLANTEEQRDILSNAVDLWDSIPRYSMSRRKQDELRQPGGYLPIRKVVFQYRSIPLTAVIRPARLEVRDESGQPTGETIEYYPSAREELIEQALRRLATENASGFFDETLPRSGLHFTLYRLRQELAARGHAMTHRDLAEGLDILSLGTIDIETEGEGQDSLGLGKFGRSPFIGNLAGVTRGDLERNPHARWYAEFHPFVTSSIDKIAYRSFNYDGWMRCRQQLARWLVKQLVLKFTQAAVGYTFVMKYSTIKRDSGMLEGYKLERQAVAALDEAWDELVERHVLTSYTKDEQRGARSKLEDVSYTLHPTRLFAAEQRAANKRQRDAKEAIAQRQDSLL